MSDSSAGAGAARPGPAATGPEPATEPSDSLPVALPGSLLEELLATAGGPASEIAGGGLRPTRGAMLGLCVDDAHPVLQGRARVRWGGRTLEKGGAPGEDAEAPLEDDQEEAWLPVLRGVTVRRRDRLLVLRPAGWDEPIVVGVVDGFRRREEVPVEGGPTLELKRDEALTVRDAEGQPILRVRDRGEGPEIQLLSEASRVRLPGRLDLSASEIRLEARDGEVRIRANDDVVVEGEVIRLN